MDAYHGGMVDLPEELERLKRFHGHLGPYAAVGFVMGRIARERFPDRIWCIAHSGTKRPMSCMADGIQMSSCCTLGKSNISLREDGLPMAEFSDGSSHLELRLREEVRERIGRECAHATEEALSLELYLAPVGDVLVVTEGSSAPFRT